MIPSQSTPALSRIRSTNRLVTMKELNAPPEEKPAPKSASKKMMRPNSMKNFKPTAKKGRIDASKPVERYLRGKSNIWVKKKS